MSFFHRCACQVTDGLRLRPRDGSYGSPSGGIGPGRPSAEMGQGGMRLDAPGLGQVDPLVGEGDLELAVARQHHRDADRERAPLAGLALQMDVAAQELGQLADDRQAEARYPGARGSGRSRPGRAALAWRNFSKIVSRSSSAMPMPVS